MKNTIKFLVLTLSIFYCLMSFTKNISAAEKELDISLIVKDAFSLAKDITAISDSWCIDDNNYIKSEALSKIESQTLNINFNISEKCTIELDMTSTTGSCSMLVFELTNSNNSTMDIYANKCKISVNEAGQYTLRISSSDAANNEIIFIKNIIIRKIIDDFTINYNPVYTGHDYTESIAFGNYSSKKYKNLFFLDSDEAPVIESYYVNGNNSVSPQLFDIEFVRDLWGSNNRIFIGGSWRDNGEEIYTIKFPQNERYEAFVLTIDCNMTAGTKTINYIDNTTTTITYSLRDEYNYNQTSTWDFITPTERENYTFLGWGLSPDSSAVVQASNYQLSSNNWYSNQTINLYAIWQPKTIQVTLPLTVSLDDTGQCSFTIKADELYYDQKLYIELSTLTLYDEYNNAINCNIKVTNEDMIINDEKKYIFDKNNNVMYIDIATTDNLPPGNWSGTFTVYIETKN